jgi:archaellum biogenesis protein FlaJ (TadC family)
MKFFNYIFYRSYINLYKTKYKDIAEARSIGFVLMYSIVFLFTIVMIANKIFNFNDHHHPIKRSSMVVYVLPIVWIVWYFVEKYYRKFSKNNYEMLRAKFEKSKYNKIVPFWLIFISPFAMMIGVTFILSLYK